MLLKIKFSKSLIGAFFVFFVVFYRLSFIYPYILLALIPTTLGIYTLIKNIINNKKTIRKEKDIAFAFFILTSLLMTSFAYDFFQNNLSIRSSVSFRLFMLILLSIIPAYYLITLVQGKKQVLIKVMEVSFWIQLVVFAVMLISPPLKKTIYSMFAMGNSVNLLPHNMETRGFGLSTEINYMSPFLMIFVCFFILKKKYILLILTSVSQLVNSNMAAIAIILSFFFSKIRLSIKIMSAIFLSIIVYFIGYRVFPRFYDEFINGGGIRTLNFLLEDHVFAINKIDIFSIIFGFQQNISSSIPGLSVYSDMGWTIMFNYGGISFIALFLLFLVSLSICAFGKSSLALAWFIIGIIFNTKGFALGPNGYIFLSFIFIFIKAYSPQNKDS